MFRSRLAYCLLALVLPLLAGCCCGEKFFCARPCCPPPAPCCLTSSLYSSPPLLSGSYYTSAALPGPVVPLGEPVGPNCRGCGVAALPTSNGLGTPVTIVPGGALPSVSGPVPIYPPAIGTVPEGTLPLPSTTEPPQLSPVPGRIQPLPGTTPAQPTPADPVGRQKKP